ncbi:hypothetical protein FRC07_006384, partial [Ceratobasidium sp. 392]
MSSSNTLLNDKKVLIIGGSSGIGYGVAAAALANRASVVIASSTKSKVDAAAERLKKGIDGKDGVTVSGESLDIKDFAALKEFLTKHAPFDHLVITAGEALDLSKGAPAAGDDLRERLGGSLDSRYWGVLNAANLIHHNKLINPGGSLVLTIGTAQKRPIPGWGFFLGAAGAVETAT